VSARRARKISTINLLCRRRRKKTKEFIVLPVSMMKEKKKKIYTNRQMVL
jgi:hypothetical protein